MAANILKPFEEDDEIVAMLNPVPMQKSAQSAPVLNSANRLPLTKEWQTKVEFLYMLPNTNVRLKSLYLRKTSICKSWRNV